MKLPLVLAFASLSSLLPAADLRLGLIGCDTSHATAFTATLKVFTRESQPLQWAFEQNNLGDIHWNRATYGGGKPEYLRAIEFFENAKQGFTEAGYTIPIPLTDQKIDLVKKQIAKK